MTNKKIDNVNRLYELSQLCDKALSAAFQDLSDEERGGLDWGWVDPPTVAVIDEDQLEYDNIFDAITDDKEEAHQLQEESNKMIMERDQNEND